jgi:hypothetical protein
MCNKIHTLLLPSIAEGKLHYGELLRNLYIENNFRRSWAGLVLVNMGSGGWKKYLTK